MMSVSICQINTNRYFQLRMRGKLGHQVLVRRGIKIAKKLPSSQCPTELKSSTSSIHTINKPKLPNGWANHLARLIARPPIAWLVNSSPHQRSEEHTSELQSR